MEDEEPKGTPAYIQGISKNDFWPRIRQQFDVMRDFIKSWEIQTKDSALALSHQEPSKKFHFQIPYNKRDGELLETNLSDAEVLLGVIETYIEQQEVSPEFLYNWGVLCERFGYLSSAQDTGGAEMGYVRAGIKGAAKKNRDPQRQWLAHILSGHLENGCKPKDAERRAARLIKDVIVHSAFSGGFDEEWFRCMINANGTLKETYCQKHFSKKRMDGLIKLPVHDIPPLKHSFPKT